jgi:hypothetical protein
MNTNIIKHEGEIDLVGVKLPCYILEDGSRVFSASETQEVLEKIGGGIGRSLEKEVLSLKLLNCRKGDIMINCYKATILVEICEFYINNPIINKNSPKQRLIVEEHEMLFNSFAKVGVNALIDEATGYQQEREKEELRALTRAYILSESAGGLISEKDKEGFIKYLKERYYSQKTQKELSK